MYKHISLAVEGSENAVHAAKEAIKIASLSKGMIVEVVYVADFKKSKTDILHASSTEALLIERRKKIKNVEQVLFEGNVKYKVTNFTRYTGSRNYKIHK